MPPWIRREDLDEAFNALGEELDGKLQELIDVEQSELNELVLIRKYIAAGSDAGKPHTLQIVWQGPVERPLKMQIQWSKAR